MALRSVIASEVDDSLDWELLVIDNNSNDDTRKVVNEFAQSRPDLVRYEFEGTPGKSNALNTGIKSAKGEIIVFVDDDVVVETNWLQNLVAPLKDPKWSGVGGRTVPMQLGEIPDWVSLSGPYSQAGVLAAAFDAGNNECELRIAPYGANMAYRKRVFEDYGGFRKDLGPSPDPDIPRHTEDIEFGQRVLAGGERIVYQPTAVVRHPISPDRLKRSYLLKWWFDYGRATSRVVGRKPNVLGIPRHLISIPKMAVTMLVPTAVRWMVTLDKQKKVFLQCWMWATAGQMLEIHRQRHNAVGQ